MPGPPAKDASTRGRRNKTTTRAVISKPDKTADDVAEEPAGDDEAPPKLPSSIEWYDEVQAWWDDLWESEPRSEWIDVDIHLLYVAARLYQMMLDPRTKATTAKALAGEYRQILVQFGLTPMARRSLQWEVQRNPKTPARKAVGQSTSSAKATPGAAARTDPRKRRLQSVK